MDSMAKSEDTSHSEVRRRSYSVLCGRSECPGMSKLILIH